MQNHRDGPNIDIGERGGGTGHPNSQPEAVLFPFIYPIHGMTYQTTDGQSADIFTKVFRDSVKWDHARKLIGVGDPSVVNKKPDAKGAVAECQGGDVRTSQRLPRTVRIKRKAIQELPLPPTYLPSVAPCLA